MFKRAKHSLQDFRIPKSDNDANFNEESTTFLTTQKAISAFTKECNEYINAWHTLLVNKSKVMSSLLYFFDAENPNRQAATIVQAWNQDTLKGFVDNIQTALKKVISDVTRKARPLVKDTMAMIEERANLKKSYERKQFKLQGNLNKLNNVDLARLTAKDEKVRNLRSNLRFLNIKCLRRFEEMEKLRTNLMDSVLLELIQIEKDTWEGLGEACKEMTSAQMCLEAKLQETEDKHIQRLNRNERLSFGDTKQQIENLRNLVGMKKRPTQKMRYFFSVHVRNSWGEHCDELSHPKKIGLKAVNNFNYIHAVFSPNERNKVNVKELRCGPCDLFGNWEQVYLTKADESDNKMGGDDEFKVSREFPYDGIRPTKISSAPGEARTRELPPLPTGSLPIFGKGDALFPKSQPMSLTTNPLLRSVQSRPRRAKIKRDRPQPPPIKKELTQGSHQPNQPILFVVKYKYTPEDDDSGKSTLHIHKGELLIVNPGQTAKNGWWYGQKMKTKERGWFPEAYVQRRRNIPKKTVPKPPPKHNT